MQLSAVPRQAAGRREGLATGGANVGTVARMGAHVFCKAAGYKEGLTADCAGGGTVAGVGAHVSHQTARLREGHAAGGAGVGAVAGMGSHVSCEDAGLREVHFAGPGPSRSAQHHFHPFRLLTALHAPAFHGQSRDQRGRIY